MYRLQHHDPGWPADVDRTISTHHQADDAFAALDHALDCHHTQLAANGEGTASLHLAIVDDTGEPVGYGTILSQTETAEIIAAGRPGRPAAAAPGW